MFVENSRRRWFCLLFLKDVGNGMEDLPKNHLKV